MDLGISGMGRMGFNMVRRLVDRGDERVIAGNRSSGKVDEAVEHGAEGAYSVEEFVGMQKSPRVLWTMLPAGDVTDNMIHQFMELADEGDIIVDGANSYFRDSVARAREVRNAGLRWLDAGVSGYLLKDAPAEDLAEALRKVHRGGRAIDPQLAIDAWTDADPLNDRERQVLRMAGDGMSATEIAARLNLSSGTVRNYLSEAIGKLGVGNRIEAYRLARQKGWL